MLLTSGSARDSRYALTLATVSASSRSGRHEESERRQAALQPWRGVCVAAPPAPPGYSFAISGTVSPSGGVRQPDVCPWLPDGPVDLNNNAACPIVPSDDLHRLPCWGAELPLEDLNRSNEKAVYSRQDTRQVAHTATVAPPVASPGEHLDVGALRDQPRAANLAAPPRARQKRPCPIRRLAMPGPSP